MRFSEMRWEDRRRFMENTDPAHFPTGADGDDMEGGGEAGQEGEIPGAPDGKWHWSGCDDNVGFGYRIARDFMDWRYLERRESQDIRSIVMLWNNEAGRRVSDGGCGSYSWGGSSSCSYDGVVVVPVSCSSGSFWSGTAKERQLWQL